MKAVLLSLLLAVQPACAADLGILTEQVNKICPIVGLSGSIKDIPSLRIDYASSATAEQMKAAQEYLAGLNEDSPEIQPPDVDGFLQDCLQSDVFTEMELIQILFCERQKDPTKRDLLIGSLIQLAPKDRQEKLVELAVKNHINLAVLQP